MRLGFKISWVNAILREINQKSSFRAFFRQFGLVDRITDYPLRVIVGARCSYQFCYLDNLTKWYYICTKGTQNLHSLFIMYNMSGLMKKIIAKLLYETKVFVTTAAEIKH